MDAAVSTKTRRVENEMSRAEQKAQTRTLLCQTAADVFEARGFAGTTMRMVAKEAGVASGTVFAHFASKSALLYAVLYDDLDKAAGEAGKTLARPAKSGAAVTETLVGVARTFFTLFESRPALYRALLQHALIPGDTAADGQPWAAQFQAQVGGLGAHVVAYLTRAQGEGLIAPHVNPAYAGMAFFSFYYLQLITLAAAGFTGTSASLQHIHALLTTHLQPQPGSQTC